MSKIKCTFFRLGLHLSLLLAIYFLCRVLFVAINKVEFNFPTLLTLPILLFEGIRFDLAAIFMVNALFILLNIVPAPFVSNKKYQKWLLYLFLITNSIFILLNIVDIVYFPYIHKRMQSDIILFLNGKKGTDFYHLLPSFLKQFWYLIIVYIVIVYLLIRGTKSIQKYPISNLTTLKDYILSVVFFILGAGVSIIAIRGGLQKYPLDVIHASDMTDVQNIPVLLNSPFTLIKTIGKKELPEINYYSESEMKDLNEGIHLPSKTLGIKKMNVVVIILESLSKKYIGYFNGAAKTPFLDSLFSESLVFPNGFANAKESIQGIPAVVASIPALGDEPFIFSDYSSNKITTIPSLLKSEGYYSAFFHGGSNGTMGFNSFSKLANYDDYFGRNEYNNEQDFDGDWGIWDEPFLQFVSQKLTTAKEPFFSSVFTLNTHQPFTIPDKYKLRFKQSGHPQLSCIAYADLALSKFFESAKKTSWYKNTLFVITADHTSPVLDQKKSSTMDHYRIPIAFFKPDNSLKGIDHSVASQVDILPSIMHLINFPHRYYSLGNDLFDSDSKKYSINYNGGVYQYIDSSYCYQFNGQSSIALYNWKKDSMLTKNLINEQKSMNLVQYYDVKLKKMIQLYNHSMVNNKMFVSE